VVARLELVFMLGPRAASEAWPASKRLAVHPPPVGFGFDPLPIGQLSPLDAPAAEDVLEGFIKRLGEGRFSYLVAKTGLTRSTTIQEIRPFRRSELP
jgi:hypothetical protein